MAEWGYEFEVVTAEVEEVSPDFLTVAEMVLFNARLKGAAVAALHPDALVVAADTLVARDGRALGKPADLAEARAMLGSLAGRSHEVYSGVWVEHRGGNYREAFVEVSRVHFRALTEAEIEEYIGRVHVLDKAGAYAAQEEAGAVRNAECGVRNSGDKNESVCAGRGIIRLIEGSRTNVIGLPMERLGEVLWGRGVEGRKVMRTMGA